jgi:hypothetical protein
LNCLQLLRSCPVCTGERRFSRSSRLPALDLASLIRPRSSSACEALPHDLELGILLHYRDSGDCSVSSSVMAPVAKYDRSTRSGRRARVSAFLSCDGFLESRRHSDSLPAESHTPSNDSGLRTYALENRHLWGGSILSAPCTAILTSGGICDVSSHDRSPRQSTCSALDATCVAWSRSAGFMLSQRETTASTRGLVRGTAND